MDWQRVRPMLERLLDVPERERAAWLDRECAGDAGLRRQLEEALAADRTGTFLEPPAVPPAAGAAERIGAYRIVRELGRGGQGVVFLARDERLNRPVALKVLSGFAAAADDVLARFRREAEVASRLDHPGICAVYETGVDQGIPWIAMRYVEGRPLAEVMADRGEPGSGRTVAAGADDADTVPSGGSAPRPSSSGTSHAYVRQWIHTIEQIARGLHAAHEAGVVHRDVKPGNVIVQEDGRPVVLDFGLARELEGETPTITRTGDVFGTPAYMSPEQISGSRRLDRRTDVYSLGVTLYEGLAGRRPFEAATREALYMSILGSSPPDLRRLNPAVSRDLATVVATAIEADRDRRYQSALDLAEELRRVRGREPVQARPVSRWTRLARWAQRNPGVAASLGLTLLSLSAGLVAALLLLGRARAAESRALSEGRRTKVALEQRTEALRRYRQMSDVAKLEDLQRKASTLWPRRRATVPRMEVWLAEARALLGRRDAHADALAALRARALPPDDAHDAREEAARRARHPRLYARIASCRSDITQLEKRLEQTRPGRRREQIEETLDIARVTLLELLGDPRLTERLVWEFDDIADTWRHQVLTGLTADLEAFAETIADVEERRSFALDVEEETVGRHAEAWRRCADDVAASPAYADLGLKPQVGLVPLGRDAASGLWEFWVRGSGPRPDWEGDVLGGAVVPSDDMGIVLVLLPGGTFKMGAQDRDRSAPNFDRIVQDTNGPVHDVTLDPFFISKYETTQAQWKRVMGTTPSGSVMGGGTLGGRDIGPRNPVEQVSWNDCARAARRLDLTLPTEAQWEYAARGGTTTPFWTGTTIGSLQGAANVADQAAARAIPSWSIDDELDDGHVVHAPVGSFRPNPFGVHDVHGNVWEWCRDDFGYYDTPVRDGDGLRPGDPDRKVARGGSYHFKADVARSSYRAGHPLDFRFQHTGVRAARPLER